MSAPTLDNATESQLVIYNETSTHAARSKPGGKLRGGRLPPPSQLGGVDERSNGQPITHMHARASTSTKKCTAAAFDGGTHAPTVNKMDLANSKSTPSKIPDTVRYQVGTLHHSAGSTHMLQTTVTVIAQ